MQYILNSKGRTEETEARTRSPGRRRGWGGDEGCVHSDPPGVPHWTPTPRGWPTPPKYPPRSLPTPSPSFRPQPQASVWQNRPGPLVPSTSLPRPLSVLGTPSWGNPAFAGQDWLPPWSGKLRLLPRSSRSLALISFLRRARDPRDPHPGRSHIISGITQLPHDLRALR